MDDIDLLPRSVDYFRWHGLLLKFRVRTTAQKLTVYSSVFGFMKETFDVRSEWTFQILKQTKLDIREGKDGEYFRLVLRFRTVEDCQLVEHWLRWAIELAEIEKATQSSGDGKGFQPI